MDADNLAIESPETLSGEKPKTLTPQQSAEITPLPLDSFKLIGGGNGIVVL